MIRALFARLTGEPARGSALFDAAVAEARQPHWFVEGEVPDTIEGRFAVLATVTAFIVLRLERDGLAELSVGLTERFVETLDTEVREMGVSDPVIGKQVRRLVGALAGRVERWRGLTQADLQWSAEVRRSLYRDQAVAEDALAHSEKRLRSLWDRISASSADGLLDGRIA